MHDSWQCASKVGELVYHLQSLTFHCNGGLLVRLARCWLINHLGLFDADCEVKAVTGVRYLIYTFLHLLFCWSTLCQTIRSFPLQKLYGLSLNKTDINLQNWKKKKKKKHLTTHNLVIYCSTKLNIGIMKEMRTFWQDKHFGQTIKNIVISTYLLMSFICAWSVLDCLLRPVCSTSQGNTASQEKLRVWSQFHVNNCRFSQNGRQSPSSLTNCIWQ